MIGCGGTTKSSSEEVVWGDGTPNGRGTGGGYSAYFPPQSFQVGAPPNPEQPGRMVPDVAADANPSSGYLIVINGRFEYQWGTFMLFAGVGVGGLWWVLNGEQPSTALRIASFLCPAAVLYTVMTVLIGKPGSNESTDPLWPFGFIAASFGFAVWAMLVRPLSEFDVALGRTTGPE